MVVRWIGIIISSVSAPEKMVRTSCSNSNHHPQRLQSRRRFFSEENPRLNTDAKLNVLFIKFDGNPKFFILNQLLHNDPKLTANIIAKNRDRTSNKGLIEYVDNQIKIINNVIPRGDSLGHIVDTVTNAHMFSNHYPLIQSESLPCLYLYKYILNTCIKMKKFIGKSKPKRISLYHGQISSKTLKDLIMLVEDEQIGSSKTFRGTDVPLKNIQKLKILYKET